MIDDILELPKVVVDEWDEPTIPEVDPLPPRTATREWQVLFELDRRVEPWWVQVGAVRVEFRGRKSAIERLIREQSSGRAAVLFGPDGRRVAWCEGR